MQRKLVTNAFNDCETLDLTQRNINILVDDLRAEWETNATNYDVIRAKFEALDALVARSIVDCGEIADKLDYCINNTEQPATAAAGNDQ